MIKKLKHKIIKNFTVFGLIFLLIFASIFMIYFNHKKNFSNKIYLNDFINNIYFKKTLFYIVDNLEPKYKKIKHKIKSGETFDKILEKYSVDKKEIVKIKDSLKKIINLNKLNTRQSIQFSLDKTNNKITEFYFQISNTQKIFLKRDYKADDFTEEIISINLIKEIVYKENLIQQSLYRAATEQEIPANIVIEFAGIYGFQIDFQRDIRKQDNFKCRNFK